MERTFASDSIAIGVEESKRTTENNHVVMLLPALRAAFADIHQSVEAQLSAILVIKPSDRWELNDRFVMIVW